MHTSDTARPGRLHPAAFQARSGDAASPREPAKIAARSEPANDPMIRLSRFPDYLNTQIGPQPLRNHHASVGLLIIFHDRHPGPPHSQAAAIQSVCVLRFLPVLEPNPRAPRLKRFEV